MTASFLSLRPVFIAISFYLLTIIIAQEDPFLERHYKPVSFSIENGTGHKEVHQVSSYEAKLIRDCFIKNFISADSNFPDMNSVLDVGVRCIVKTKMHKADSDFLWISFDQNQTDLEPRKYRKYKVKAKIGNVQYFSRPEIAPQADVLAVKWIHNSQSDSSISSVVSEEVSREETASVKITHSYGGSISLGFSVSVVSVSMSVGYKGSQSSTTETTTVKTYTLEDTVNVAANSSVKVTWNLIQQDTIMDWKAPMYVTGAAAYKLKYEDRIHFIPLGELAKFFKEFQPDKDDIYTMHAFVEGVVKGKKGIASTIRTFHFPLSLDSHGLEIGQCANA